MADSDLRARLEAACIDELARVGPDDLDRGALVRRFEDQGVSARTRYRWLADFLDSGRAGQALVRRVEDAAAARAARTSDPAAEVAREVGELLPKSASPDKMIGSGPIPIMDHLHTVIHAAHEVMAHARTQDGKVRNAKLLLTASDKLRQCLDTATRITTAMNEFSQVQKFHAAVLDELRAESPALAERVLARFNRISTEWGSST